MKLFLDTNVLIDFILERQPFYQAAAMIISYAEENKVQICVSSLSLVTTNFNTPIDIIFQSTGLSIEEIKKLKS